ncbi:TIGR03621 family F420-dependent LLM class oxidoreductase [Nonomuraea glycinis]|uniref:TIGR03621 family F420-dependent LLM class oxidoreductase n=1 Tax=Nonomuraea glycinis TaxID=2047744 RepID=UPI002E11643A|nr:TIGR03621 family F420-dependent LLM class oxidoreductase [Nonomuraea glycinis]
MRRFRFGAVVREAGSGREWADLARRVEGAGFDVLLVPDHLVGDRFAPLPALTAAACATSRLRVGTLVLANDFRQPAVLAKELATLDVLSEGRLEIGLGTGWMAADYEAAGLALRPPGVRVDRLEEAIAVLKGLWSGEEFSFSGAHHTLRDMRLRPRPVQRPHPPLLLGAGGPRMVRLAARQADSVNLAMRVRADGRGPDPRDGGAGAFLTKLQSVREAAGSRYDRLELGTSVVEVGERGPAQAWSAADRPSLEGTPQVLLGTRRDIVDQLRHWRDEHDVSYFVVHHEHDLDAFIPIVEELAAS